MNDNKLIAEFMGVHDEISLDSIAGNVHSWSDAPFFYITEDSKEKVIENISEHSKYHESWDWLMPVIRKVLTSIDIDSLNYDTDELKFNVLDCDIEGAHKEVVEFLKDQVCHVELKEWERRQN